MIASSTFTRAFVGPFVKRRSAVFASASMLGVTMTFTSLAAFAQDEPVARTAKPPPARQGIQLSLRTGYSHPFGEVRSGRDLSASFAWQIPVTLDVTYKVTKNVALGVYAGAAFGHEKGAIGERLGVEAFYHFEPAAAWNPWIGIGVGWEFLSRDVPPIVEHDGREPNGSTTIVADTIEGMSITSGNVNGPEFVHLMAGFESRTSQLFGLGPFLDLSIARYDNFSDSISSSAPINVGMASIPLVDDTPRKAVHAWLTIGVKLTLWP